MAKDIKQRSIIKDVKMLDRSAALLDKMKAATVKAKAESEDIAYGGTREQSPYSYIESKTSNAGKTAIFAASEITHLATKKAPRSFQPDSILRASRRNKEIKTKHNFLSEKNIRKPDIKLIATRTKDSAIRQQAAKTLAIKKVQQKMAAKNAKAAAVAFSKSVRAILTAIRSLVLALSAGGAVAIFVIALIIIVAAILASALAIFFADEAGNGMQIKEAVFILSEEFADTIEAIKTSNPYDELEMVTVGGSAGLDWKSIIAIYAVKTTENADNPAAVIVMDEENLDRLRIVTNDMNTISYKTRSETREYTAIETDPDTSEEVSVTKTFTVTILTITITKQSVEEMANAYLFSKSQRETLSEMLSTDYDKLWEDILGAAQGAGGSGTPYAGITPKGIFTWPLGQTGTITSYFGWRDDPFTGEPAYHEGLDLGVAEGTPILAAADGTVIAANKIDSYGSGWGYYVKIRHVGGYETLYAHCSMLAVSEGDTVTRGQIIAYVGQTGRSTAPHLHWEVYLNETRTDPLSYFD